MTCKHCDGTGKRYNNAAEEITECGCSRKRRSPFDAAEEKGRQAARDGLPITACPYLDKRKPCGRLTFSRAFRCAWQQGFQSECVDIGRGVCW